MVGAQSASVNCRARSTVHSSLLHLHIGFDTRISFEWLGVWMGTIEQGSTGYAHLMSSTSREIVHLLLCKFSLSCTMLHTVKLKDRITCILLLKATFDLPQIIVGVHNWAHHPCTFLATEMGSWRHYWKSPQLALSVFGINSNSNPEHRAVAEILCN